MPFDGNPAKFVKPEVFSLEGLVAWLEQQDLATRYAYNDPSICLMARYTEEHGGFYRFGDYILDGTRMCASSGGLGPLKAAVEPLPHTYRAALKRARQLLATA